MASSALIVANDNIFNRAVLEEDAFYFSDANQISELLNSGLQKESYCHLIERNRQKIAEFYSWEHITDLLETSLSSAVNIDRAK
jgi:hypothetical protein